MATKSMTNHPDAESIAGEIPGISGSRWLALVVLCAGFTPVRTL